MTMMPSAINTLLALSLAVATVESFSSPSGRGFGPPPSSGNGGASFVSFDRFRSSCPADIDAVRRFDPTLLEKAGGEEHAEDDVWVAVYRSANNLPSVFVRDAFMDAMRISTTAQDGDSETLVSSPSSSNNDNNLSGVISNNGGTNDDKPVAVARLGKDPNSEHYILDSMRCVLKKENTDPECDGGSEHAEAIGVCIDELVSSYLQRYLAEEDDGEEKNGMAFDGGVHFRGTLVSGKLLDSRGFREVVELSEDMHSHESDIDGVLAKYAERSASKEVAKNPGARDRALRIVSYLGRVDRVEDRSRARRRDGIGDRGESEGDGDDEQDSVFDPWASVKRYY